MLCPMPVSKHRSDLENIFPNTNPHLNRTLELKRRHCIVNPSQLQAAK